MGVLLGCEGCSGFCEVPGNAASLVLVPHLQHAAQEGGGMTHGIDLDTWNPAQAGPRDKPGYGIDPDYMPAEIVPDDGPGREGPAVDPAGEEAKRSPGSDIERQTPADGVERQSEPPLDEMLPSDP
jgi:hypothetical protein